MVTAKYFFKYLHTFVVRRLKLEEKLYTSIAGKPVMSGQEGNDFIREALKTGKPFMACKFGSTEMCNLNYQMLKPFVNQGRIDYAFDNLCTLSGFFPHDESLLLRFYDTYMETIARADLLATGNEPFEGYLVEKYAPNLSFASFTSIEPWYWENPWSADLKGKKVLVIHPFAETIKSQYEKREHLHKNPDILPEFELHTLKAVQTLAGEKDERFETWFDALEYMYDEAMKIDFDIAIIGCGAYGMPLAGKLKTAGKQVIHLGGSTQLFFGIMGKRWEDNPTIMADYNEYWTRPGATEVIKNASKVEEACYW